MNIIRLIVLVLVSVFASNAISSKSVNAIGARQKTQPAPSAVTQTRNSFWISIGKDLNLNHQTQLASVQLEIRRFVKDKERLTQILKASAPYIYYFHQATQKKNLPAELAFIPFVESEYNPDDRSSAGALGLWQLTRTTAKLLGVKVKYNYDGRRNIIKSTDAALTYFASLGKEFDGNWTLAISAYNCGDARVQHAIRKAGSHNFQRLSLPRETHYYTSRVLAIAEIIKHPRKYGVTLPPIANKPYFAELNIKKPVKLAELAKKSDVSLKTLKKLNPDYRYAAKPKTVLVPVTDVL